MQHVRRVYSSFTEWEEQASSTSQCFLRTRYSKHSPICKLGALSMRVIYKLTSVEKTIIELLYNSFQSHLYGAAAWVSLTRSTVFEPVSPSS